MLLAAVRFRADHDRLVGGDDAFVGRIRVELEETRCTSAETRRHGVVINRGEVAVDDERASRRSDIGMQRKGHLVLVDETILGDQIPLTNIIENGVVGDTIDGRARILDVFEKTRLGTVGVAIGVGDDRLSVVDGRKQGHLSICDVIVLQERTLDLFGRWEGCDHDDLDEYGKQEESEHEHVLPPHDVPTFD